MKSRWFREREHKKHVNGRGKEIVRERNGGHQKHEIKRKRIFVSE